jgi:hypothetical protein
MTAPRHIQTRVKNLPSKALLISTDPHIRVALADGSQVGRRKTEMRLRNRDFTPPRFSGAFPHPIRIPQEELSVCSHNLQSHL